MQHKSEQEEIFMRLHQQLERQFDGKVKIFQSDNGGEYLSKTFTKYLALEGIEHQTTVKECSAQNGLSERGHLTLMDMARSMLQHSGLPLQFWGQQFSMQLKLQIACHTPKTEVPLHTRCSTNGRPTQRNLRYLAVKRMR